MGYTYKGNHFPNYKQIAYFLYCEDNNIKYEEKSFKRKELQSILKFVYTRYGRSALSRYKDRTVESCKRKVIDIVTVPDLSFYKNKNVKLRFLCKECGHPVITSYSTFSRFKDNLCKDCRKKSQSKKKDTN